MPEYKLICKVVRDVRERGRDIEGCIKQWFKWVKPNYHQYVFPQREVADLIIPRGIENTVAISMITDRVTKILTAKSRMHQVELKRLGKVAEDAPLSENAIFLTQTRQIVGINTLLINPATETEDFIFYFDRICSLLIETALSCMQFRPNKVITPQKMTYHGLAPSGEVSAVVILRGGSTLETALKRCIPDCRTGRMLIQTNYRTGEPELHYLALADDITEHGLVLLLDSQMSSGGAALMAVKVLVDHGVDEKKIVFVTYVAGRIGINRTLSVFPDVRVVVCRLGDDMEERWVERRYLGC
jgi:uridine kinase